MCLVVACFKQMWKPPYMVSRILQPPPKKVTEFRDPLIVLYTQNKKPENITL